MRHDHSKTISTTEKLASAAFSFSFKILFAYCVLEFSSAWWTYERNSYSRQTTFPNWEIREKYFLQRSSYERYMKKERRKHKTPTQVEGRKEAKVSQMVKSYFQRKTMTRKIATNGVSDCVESHRYRMKKSIFIELSFLAFLLMPWQISHLQELFFSLLNLEWS